MWLSTMKYFSPSFWYTLPPHWAAGYLIGPLAISTRPRARRRLGLARGQVESDVVRRVLRVGEHDRPVVLVDHPAVVRGHVLLELGRVEEAGLLAEGLGDLVVVDDHRPGGVDPDHRRQEAHGHVGLVLHDLRHHDADLVVHQREPALVGGRAVGLERALGRREGAHWDSSSGVSRLRSDRIPDIRLLAWSRPSSKRGGLASGCDHSGCRVRAAEIARGTQADSQPCMICLLWAANSRSAVSSSNIARV